ncbi:PREDICTED: nicotinamide riboside kinase 1 [Rhagoletis zephyria]|uniref:nicotinamide riboside kinase 1 n=1 Tax=Rhagoletis zephyria TaxID=28612 RepID=UPI000811A391|nr:PREDICTED: nicotinamide riboside kinase 1 [Rhagoletis zephyria]
MPSWLVIGVSGVTCGGKTTLAHRLRDYFKQMCGAPLWSTPYIVGDVQLISQDDYFLPVDDLRHKWNDKLNVINFELLSSLDMKQMLSDIKWTMKGRYLATDPMENIDFINEMSMSTNFEHYTQPVTQQIYQPNNLKANQCCLTSRHQNQTQTQRNQHAHLHAQQHHNHSHAHTSTNAAHSSHIMRINSQLTTHLRDNKINLLIIEGFTIFNEPKILKLCNIKFHFHLPYEKCYERRQKRTYDPPDVTGYFEICVWPHYEKNFNEIRDRQDVTFLNGELSKERLFKFVLQKIANHFEERCDVACPPPQKLLGIPSCLASGTVVSSESCVGNSAHLPAGVTGNPPKTCPMEQQ